MSEEESGTQQPKRTHKTLSMRLTPFKNKRPIFDPKIFGSSPRASPLGRSKRSRLGEVAENGLNRDNPPTTPKPIHLWSSPVNSSSSLNRRARRLELNSTTQSSKDTTSTTEIKTSWTESFAQFDRRKHTRKVQNEAKVGRAELTKAERELLAELMKKELKKPTLGPGWMTFDEFRKSAPPKRDRSGTDPRPYSWRKKANTVTQAVQTETTTTEATTTETQESTSTTGGGKVRAKKNRNHESRKKPEPDTLPTPSYSLDNIQPVLTLDATKPLTFDEPKRKEETKATKEEGTFSQPRTKTTDSSQPKNGKVTEFSFSQPYSLNKLNVDSQKKETKSSFGDLFSKSVVKTPVVDETPKTPIVDSEPVLAEKKEEKPKEAPKEATPPPKPLTTSGFGDFFAKQKKSGNWTCPVCMMSNAADMMKCPACEEPNPNAPKVEEKKDEKKEKEAPKFSFGVSSSAPSTSSAVPFTGFGAAPKVTEEKKEAPKFTFGSAKKEEEKKPEAPKEATPPPPATKPAAPATTSGFGDFFAKQKKSGNWTCPVCMMSNAADMMKCPACEEPNPNAPKVAATEAPKEKEAPKFTFGVAAPSTTTTSSESEKPKAPSFGFGSSQETTKPSFSFGAPKEPEKKVEEKKPEEPKKPSFSFGAPVEAPPAPAPTPAATPAAPSAFGQKRGRDESGFSFEKKDSSKSFSFKPQEAKKETPSFSFGGAKAESSSSSGLFGAKPVEQKSDTFSFKPSEPAAPPVVTAPTTETPAAFGGFGGASAAPAPAKPSFSFGGGAPPAKKEAPSFSFGAKKEETAAPPSFSFGKTEEKKETPSFGFGEKKNEAPSFSFGKTEKPASGLFGGASNTTTTTAAPPSFSFGGGAPKEPEKKTNGFSFGSAPAPTPNGGGSIFGGAAPAAPPSFSFAGGAPPQQQQQQQAQTNSNSNNSGFGFNASKPSIFAPQQPQQGSMFGEAKAAPSFNFGGASNNADKPFTFGGSQSAPTQQQQNGGSMFNSQPAVSNNMFGESKPAFGSQPTNGFAFGGQSAPSFGAPSQSTNSFQPQQPQQNNMFAASQQSSQSQGTPGGRRIARARRRGPKK